MGERGEGRETGGVGWGNSVFLTTSTTTTVFLLKGRQYMTEQIICDAQHFSVSGFKKTGSFAHSGALLLFLFTLENEQIIEIRTFQGLWKKGKKLWLFNA